MTVAALLARMESQLEEIKRCMTPGWDADDCATNALAALRELRERYDAAEAREAALREALKEIASGKYSGSAETKAAFALGMVPTVLASPASGEEEE